MSNPTTPSNTGRSRGLIVVLALSLFINIGLIGFLAGRWINMTATPHMPPPSIGIGRFLRSLDEERREALKPQISAHFDSLRPNIRAGRKAHKAVRNAIAANPFAPEELEQALVQLNSNRGSGAAEQAGTFTRLVAQLSAEERIQLAKSMKRRRGHRGRSQRDQDNRTHTKRTDDNQP